MHLNSVGRILEPEDSLADAEVVHGPLPKRAVIRAREHLANGFDSFKVVDLICVS